MTDLSTHTSAGVRRRAVLGGAAALAALGPLQALGARTAGAAPMKKKPFSPDYGPLAPVRDQATGLELLLLPQGFQYISYGWTGDPMDDGRPTPGAHDGMATFEGSAPGEGAGRGKTDQIALVRNHELGGYGGAFTQPAYDPAARGGTTNLLFDPRGGKWLGSSPSLSGTIRNCAGGTTPQGSWLTCEETTESGPDGTPHGYIFEVSADGLGDPEPYRFMGRFSHEAVCVDPDTGIVYETEDATPSGFYRFLPNNPNSLAAGGRLQMLAVEGSSPGVPVITYADGTGTEYFTSWVDIDDPDPADPIGAGSTVQQGIARGGAQFTRLEGAWWHEGKAYILSTDGGPSGNGQVFEYDPPTETMRVLFASPNPEVLRNPDNICVSPRDGIVLCEDGGGIQRLHGLTLDGEIFEFARNNVVIPAGGAPGKSVAPGDYRTLEWCGSTFDRRGDWLFANIQTPGITFAITGPWRDGSL